MKLWGRLKKLEGHKPTDDDLGMLVFHRTADGRLMRGGVPLSDDELRSLAARLKASGSRAVILNPAGPVMLEEWGGDFKTGQPQEPPRLTFEGPGRADSAGRRIE